MKTQYPITSLILILSVGCSDFTEKAENEPKQNEVRQRSIQAMQETFIAASNSLQAVPMAPLVVTNILCSPFREAENSNRFLTPKNGVELAASGSCTEVELDQPTDN
jgi:hypothetical protein